MKGADNKSSSGGRIIIDLDALAGGPLISKGTVQALATANQAASTAIANLPAGIFSQIAHVQKQNMRYLTATLGSVHQMINIYFEPLRKVMEVVQESIQRIVQQIREMFDRFIKPLTFLLSTQPIYLVQRRPVIEEKSIDSHLSIETSTNGFFVIGGKKLRILHPNSSRCGKLLAALLKYRSRVVDYPTLRQEIGAGDLDKTFKDLKYQLKQQGIILDYERPRSYGIALNGLLKLQ